MQHEYTPQDIERFWRKVDRRGPDDCWYWTASRRQGYGQFWTGQSVEYSHRTAYELSFGEIPNGLFVCHKCDNRQCCNPNHLFLGSQKDNMDDMRHKGRGATGEKHGRRKLTDAQVVEIRSRYSWRGFDGENTLVLAKEYEVSSEQIGRIVNYKSRS